MLKWLKASQATQVGTALADDVVLQTPPASALRDNGSKPALQERELQKFLQKFLQRVDREARPLRLNFFKRAKLANSFKWRLLEKGVEKQLVEELTQALVLRLTPDAGGPVRPDDAVIGPGRRARARDAHALLSQGADQLARGAYAEAAECYQQVVS